MFDGMINDFFSGVNNSMTEIEKGLERLLISHIYAPVKLNERNNLMSDGDIKIKTEAQATKTALGMISSQIDTTMKGPYSTKVVETLKTKEKDYDAIV